MSDLDFSVVSNNDVTVYMDVLTSSGAAVNGSNIADVKWQWFIDGATVTKQVSLGSMAIYTANPLVLAIPVLSSDTVAAPEGSYAHEAVTVDTSGNAVTVVNNDPRLSWGKGYIRKQKTVQP